MGNESAEIDLLPCPFCGAEVQFEENPSHITAGVAFAVMCVTEDCILYDAVPGLWPTKTAAAVAWNHRPPVSADVQQLMRFYSVGTILDLIAIQARHIERLQAKVPPLRDTQPRNYREG